MGDSRHCQSLEGPPKALTEYFRRARSSQDREAAEEAVAGAVGSGRVPDLELREKCAELLREHIEDQRQVEAGARRPRIVKRLRNLALDLRRLPRREQQHEIIGAFMQAIAPALEQYLSDLQSADHRSRGRRPMEFYKKSVSDFRALGATREEAHAIARGLGIRAGKTPTYK